MPREPTDSELDDSLKLIPTASKIVEQALIVIPTAQLSSEHIRTNFYEAVVLLEKLAYELFLEFEKKTVTNVIELWTNKISTEIQQASKKMNHHDFVIFLCTTFWPIAKRLEFRLGQMRKSRAGAAFEFIIQYLLKKIGIDCQKPFGPEARTKLNRIDLVVPSQNVALTTPDKARYISCKRTLRERWKQTVPEQKRGWTVYLLTLDTRLPDAKAKEIDERGLIAFVRDELKEGMHLRDKTWIRKLSDLPNDLHGLT